MGNVHPLDQLWEHEPIKVIEMYCEPVERTKPANKAWFDKHEDAIEKTRDSILSSYTLPYGKHKGRSFDYVARADWGYFVKMSQTPSKEIVATFKIWKARCLDSDPKICPLGQYAEVSYLNILELDPVYLLEIIDGKISVISQHARPWIRDNLGLIQQIRSGFIGENLCGYILNSMGIAYQREWSLPAVPGRRYDYQFSFRGRHYLLEFDGEQHFSYPNRWHKTQAEFDEGLKADVEKTSAAIRFGYVIIRIAHVHLKEIRHHIEAGLAVGGKSYYSDPGLYDNLRKKL